MTAGSLGCIRTPHQGNQLPVGATWCADNGCFADRWDADHWWRWLTSVADTPHCRFAVAPDVVGDADATARRARPWLAPMAALGLPVAYVAQNGAEVEPPPWDSIHALFIGGDTSWKLGTHARRLIAEAKARGLLVHMGRVNSERRYRYAAAVGCDSVDGTYLTFGPDANLPRLQGWLRAVDQPALFQEIAQGISFPAPLDGTLKAGIE